MTDRLTPPQLRDLADILWPASRPDIDSPLAWSMRLTATSFREEAARREAEAKPKRPTCPDDGAECFERPCVEKGACAMPDEREGPGSAPARPFSTDYKTTALQAADRIEALTARNNELATSLNSCGLRADTEKARADRLAAALETIRGNCHRASRERGYDTVERLMLHDVNLEIAKSALSTKGGARG